MRKVEIAATNMLARVKNGSERFRPAKGVKLDTEINVATMFRSPLIPEFAGFINGQWRKSDTGTTIAVTNPANGDRLAEIPDMGKNEAQLAVDAANHALTEEFPINLRASWLSRMSESILGHREELARIITLEQGKPLKESLVEVEYAAGFFTYYAGQLGHLSSRALPLKIRGCNWNVHLRPAGVVALITPWNFPLAMLAKKLSAAVAAGCSVVVKPSELTPLSAIAFWSLATRENIPISRLNLLLGRPAAIGKVLCTHPSVRVLSFTGSTSTGKLLLRLTANHVKRLLLELGGNAPFIVFEDADLDLAVNNLVANKFRCAGQTCVCANRVYIHRTIRSEFIQKLIPALRALRMGDGMEAQTDIGPLINLSAFSKVTRHVRDALNKRAQRIVGYDPGPVHGEFGCFYPPTLLTGANRRMKLFEEETFGPVIAVADFSSEAEVIDEANWSGFGLAAYIFTSNAERAERCARLLQFGHVGVNSGVGPTPEAPFGGMRQSGFGREGGVEGLIEFCETQTLVIA